MDNVVLSDPNTAPAARLRIEICGAVQGVGFRPFIYRLATEAGLAGWVRNGAAGVVLELEGPPGVLAGLAERIRAERPPAALLLSLEQTWLPPLGLQGFTINPSDEQGSLTVQVLPDLATCPECRDELHDPRNRRFGYPFTNCTNCGPRFSIVTALPYDRPHTTMAGFRLCAACTAEYNDPADRRFHAQPNACPQCGPQLALWQPTASGSYTTLATGTAALQAALEAIRAGQIVAVKGLSGFHLICDARNEATVLRLRERKRRPRKPFALMVRDVAMAKQVCSVPPAAATLLGAPEGPIVLLMRRKPPPSLQQVDKKRIRCRKSRVSMLATKPALQRKRGKAQLAASIAPDQATLGLMLPSNPLHHLLMAGLEGPVVATSGNLSDEPICIAEYDALTRLAGLADLLLVHDRPIARHGDDSIVWILEGEARLLRRARGYAPAPVLLRAPVPIMLGLGAHLKSSVALAIERQVFISQHIGDLDDPVARQAFDQVVADLVRLYAAQPLALAHDLHPDYYTTQVAQRLSQVATHPPTLIAVQHHHAHFAACLAEHQHNDPALGIIWDGTGYGLDGTIWGGEFLLGNCAHSERFAYLRPFALPGGEAAIREPWRVALALLDELEGDNLWQRDDLVPVRRLNAAQRPLLQTMLKRGLNSPRTSSAGRLFDGIAALLGLCQVASYEGEAALLLEYYADPHTTASYPFSLDGPQLDWRPCLAALLEEQRRGVPISLISARFHNSMVAAMVSIAQQSDVATIALSGGCFQNRRLSEHASQSLRTRGKRVLMHRLVPTNDGGICLGQVATVGGNAKSDSR